MTVRPIIMLLVAALVTLCPITAYSASDKLNVLMILMDDLGWRDLHCTGSTFYETPNIDKLAAGGVMFTRSYAAAPICSPTRASIVTGLYPGRIGLTLPSGTDPIEVLEARVQKRAYSPAEAKSKQTVEQPVRGGPALQKAVQVVSATRLPIKHPSIARLFKANGYRTAHFGKWHLGPEPFSALDHGFDVDVPHINSAGPPQPGHFGPWPDWPGESGAENKGRHVDECLAEHAAHFIHENKDRPFYLNFWSYGVHIPFQAKPELIQHFEQTADPNAGQRNPKYAAMIKHTDDAIGRVWKAVEEAGLAEKTVVVFLSDNGGVNWGSPIPITDTQPLRGGKGDVYEGGVRVPGFVVWPGTGKAGTKSDTIFTSMDVLPTLAEICSLRDVPAVDGRSIAPAVAGKPLPSRPFFMHYAHYGNWNKGGHPATSVVADGWKLIRFYFDGAQQQHRYELYHLDEDVGESVNLAELQPERVQELDRLIDGFLADTKAVQPKRNPDYHPEPSAKANVISSTRLRVEVSEHDGALSITDLRNKRVWQQVRVETEETLKQKIVGFDVERNELTLECGLAGVRADGKRATVPARITLRVPARSSEVELTVHCDTKDPWRQAAYPYVFVRDGERTSNLFPHCEGMLVPVRKNDPDWFAIPDGDLYGGVHSYLMCLGLVDEASGEGLLTLLPDVEATSLNWRDVPLDEQTVVAPQFVCRSNKGSFDRPWRVKFSFSDSGGYVALAQRYREFFAAQGLHKTLREKARENPAVHEILGAPIFWANTRTPLLAADMAYSFRDAGVDRCLFAMCNVPLHKPDVPDWEEQMAVAIKRVRSLGNHVYRYDQYRDAFQPDPTKGHHHQINTNAWPDKLVRRADGSRVSAFGPASGIVCAKHFLPLAKETFDHEFRDFEYSARFLDCLGSVGFNMEAECFDPAHQCDRYYTRQQRIALLAEVNRRGKLASTECGLDYLIPHVHWFEGASTLVRWKEFFPVKQRTETAGINDATGSGHSGRLSELAKLAPTERPDLSVSISTRYRIPFYSLCHHDEVIATWRWEDGMDDPLVYWPLKNLWSVLNGTPPLYRTTADRIAKYRDEITRTQHYVSDWVREVALDAMTNHRFVTEDRLVQESEFSSGRGVVVNFGDTNFTLPDGTIVKAREYQTYRITAGRRDYVKPQTTNVFSRS
jgi:arylsulfatase A-like enzyme